MLPELRQDRSALRWIRGELDQTLREARASLEDFVDGENNRLEQCVGLLHHVHGALEMVQVYGAAMLADEMEQLALALSQGQAKRVEPAAEALMLGMVQLPAYLEKIEGGGADIPLVLLPLMNDLRAARDAPLVSETSLFAPKLDAVIAAETVRPGSGNRELPKLVGKLRSRYHRGLLNWIRNQDVEESLAQLREVLDTLNSAAGTTRLRRLLDAAEALATALAGDSEAPALAVKPLFGKLDRVFKHVIDQGEESAMLEFPVDLLKNLLYYIARSNSTDPAVLAVKHSADLVNTFPEHQSDGSVLGSLGAPDRELFDAVSEALAQDLREVKDQFDLYIRSDRSQLERLTALAAPIQRIGDTLGMVGRGDLRTRLKHRCDELHEVEQSAQPPAEDRLMALAADLLHVESSLSSLGDDEGVKDAGEAAGGGTSLSHGEMQQHVRAAIEEALVELAKTKDTILEYLDNPTPSAAEQLDEVPARLHAVAGALQMLGLSEAGQLLLDLKPYITSLPSRQTGLPDAQERDALADVVISAELYMQSAIEPGSDRGKLLQYAEAALDRLGLRSEVEAVPGAPVLQEVAEAEAAEAESVEEAGLEESDQADDASALAADAVEAPSEPLQDVSDELSLDLEAVEEPATVEETSDAGDQLETAVDEPGAQAASVESDSSAETAAETGSAPVIEPEAPPAVDTEESDVETVDSEILEIFAEEADEELQVIQENFPKWRSNLDDRESLATIRRSFHTLKGSGRIVGAMNIGEFAWSIENLLNRVIDGTVSTTPELLALLNEAVDTLPTLVAESQQRGGTDTDVSALSARAFAVAAGETVPAVEPQQAAADSPPVEEAVEEVVDEPSATLDVPDEVAYEAVAEQSVEPSDEELQQADDELQVEIPEAFVATDIAVDSDLAPNTVFEPLDAPEEHGVADGDVVLELEPVSHENEQIEIASVPEDAVELRDDGSTDSSSDAEAASVIESAEESILTAIDVQDSDFIEADTASVGAGDSSLNAVFLNEAQGHLQVLADFVAHCTDQNQTCDFNEGIRRAMHTLRGSSRTAGVDSIAALAGDLEQLGNLMHDEGRQADAPMLELLRRSHQAMTELAAMVEDPHREVPNWEPLHQEIAALVDGIAHHTSPAVESAAEPQVEVPPAPTPTPTPTPAPAAAPAPVADDVDPELLEIFLEEAKELLEALEGELSEWESAPSGDRQVVAKLQRTLHTMKGGARLAGLMSIGDLSHALESAFESVVEQRTGGDARLQGLVRYSTDALALDIDALVKGGGLYAHPDLIERLEAAAHGRPWDDLAPSGTAALDTEPAPRLEAVETASDEASSSYQPDSQELDVESALLDEGAGAAFESESVLRPAGSAFAVSSLVEDGDEDSELLADSQLMTDSELLGDSSFLVEDDDGQFVPAVGHESTVVQFPGGEQFVENDGFVPRRPLPEEPVAPASGGERVRVASEALDNMVNNAGEVSIYRARIEQQNSSFAFNLGELGQTIHRLRGQLRDLELETEAQILSRHEREGETLADFDPLEMDRYSTIQQLSRALSETVEDLSNLGQSLSDLSRDTDTLLLQQARVTTDLQDSLLRTRMVKFSSRVPRLERVVRQTSHSVGKQANLDVVGGEEDMDRAILERMMGPLEHLLRNSVSHGIEDANTRLANRKPPQGLITLQLAREGTDVVLTLSDDGAGLDRARIRAKAVERGLLDENMSVEDDDLFQFILQPGFSTAQELSQVSGRGVGMDVVLTEVKQLGGTLEIASQSGYGTSFTIRLPFTLAITDALLVTLGEDIYAVPHSSMDGVVRIGLDELRAIYAGEQEHFHYGGRDYVVRYLGSMLGTHASHLPDGVRWMPLLLVRSGEHRVAIQVDSLLGNRQIVVKSVGAQLSTVRWFTGGTILADGQIALILDTNSLVRIDSTQQGVLEPEMAEPESKGVSVMVVDDSITVRKVTSRLLERHNMQVVTAKDGVDAVALLQEHRPDVMLLDIEMPRMDGYELARHMRSTPELSDIPIIMITSRSGDKHRNRAFELGVKRYLGKPYQEAELLENIYTVLADTAS